MPCFQQLVLLGIYGLAFNYFASAPILVWHAVRYKLFNTCTKSDVSCCSKWLVRVVFILAVLTVLSVAPSANLKYDWLDIAVITMAFIYFITQALMLLFVSCNKKELYRFYVNLHKARGEEKIDTDSYKHLREHGNAFLIVIHNVMLLGVLSSIITVFGAAGFFLVLLWILPAAYIYFLAHGIEADMIYSD